LRPRYQHYYFGDYYSANYQAAGFYPSYSYNSGRYGYDPLFAHERWQHRQDGQWQRRVAADFQNRRDHEDARPPRTWAAQRALSAAGVRSRETNPAVAAPFSQFTKSQNSPLRYQPVDALERQKLAQRAQDVQRFGEERQKLETTAAAHSAGQPAKPFSPATGRLPLSPIVARPNAELGKNHVPPQMHMAPKPDFTVEAKPRATRSPEQPQQHVANRPPRPPLETTQPQPQPRIDRPAPQPQPRGEGPASQPRPQPKVDRPAPHAAAGPPSAGPNQDKHK
jgi:hypothetical protein